MTPDERARLFLRLAKYIGREVPAGFLRRTGEEYPELGVPCLHSLSEGIFKPADSPYALCVWSRSAAGADREVYADVIHPQAGGGWAMDYAAKSGSLDSAINRSLLACLRDRQPVLVIVTSRAKGAHGGARYWLLGPALIEDFDPASRRFHLAGCTETLTNALEKVASPVESEEILLRQRLFTPFALRESQAPYMSRREPRDQAFRIEIIREYRQLCCVCRSMFVLKQPAGVIVEAEAAHIIPVAEHGPDDLRNGLSLCRRHHWAFDQGLFTVNDLLEVRVSPAVQRAERQRFDLEEYAGERLVPPASAACRPSEKALEWHRRVKFLAG